VNYSNNPGNLARAWQRTYKAELKVKNIIKKFIASKSKMHHNIIRGSYLIIYHITTERVVLLRVFNSRMSIRKIRGAGGAQAIPRT